LPAINQSINPRTLNHPSTIGADRKPVLEVEHQQQQQQQQQHLQLVTTYVAHFYGLNVGKDPAQ